MMVPTRAKILVVDDDRGVLLTTRAILEREGYDIESAEDGAAALESIRHRHYDLVLTDLKMPVVDGLAVLAEVRKRSPLTVTVIMTGHASLNSGLQAVQLGAYEYLLKPFEIEKLKQAVRRSLERKRLSEIDTLYQISGTVTRSRDATAIGREVSDAVKRVLGLADACLMIYSDQKWVGDCPDAVRRALQNEALFDSLSGAAIVTDREQAEDLRESAISEGIHSFALVPGVVNERLVCVLFAGNGTQPYEFHASAQRFLQALANQTALAVENASLISELKNNNEKLDSANRKLRELDKLKSNFLSIATHELRTPLSVILGYNAMLAETLQDRLDEPEKQTMVESIAACKRLIRLVNSMLDISQIEAGKMKMNFAAADLRHVVSSVASLFQHDARGKNIRLGVELPSRLPRVQIDAERIEQVLVNLIGNALKFTPTGGSILVRVRHHADSRQIEVGVRDTGVGIAAEDQPKIFDEFAQLGKVGTQRQQDGSGLGLAITKRIIEAHEGQLSVASTPGSGSTFSFTLPLKSRDVRLGSAASA
jgi:signal transduction histidine kinase/CheY-like chemotaxis protein